MNMNGIYANQTRSSNAVTREDKSSLSYEKGQIIEGIISKVSDQISINFSGREISFSNETVRDAKEGEIRRFQIMDVSKNSIVLKEVGSTKGNIERAGGKTSFTMVYIDPSTLMESSEKSENGEEENKLEDISERMTEEDYNNLSKEGLSLEYFNLNRLEAALARIKSAKLLKQDALQGQVKQLEQVREFAKEAAKKSASNSMHAEQIATRLIELDLPVTIENIEQMLSTMELAKEVTKLDDASCSYLIANQLEPTAKNIYKAVHSRTVATQSIGTEVWNELKSSVERVIKEAGLTLDDSTLDNARWLISKELPVNENNLRYKQMLDRVRTMDVSEYAISAAVAEIRYKTSENYELFGEEKNAIAKQVVHDYNTLSTSALARAVHKKSDEIGTTLNEEPTKVDINLEDLRVASEELENEANKTALNISETSAAFITAKRQLEEIRLRLTVEVSNKMLAKGIRLETESLEKIVEELKNQEDIYYRSLLQEVGAGGEEQLSLLKDTSNHLAGLKEAPNVILGTTFANRTIQTISSLSELGSNYEEKFKKAGESYETLMTKPRPDMGDSIQKAFSNIDSMLEHMNMEPTKANARAVRILAYNNIEINEDNIISMKLYDAKVNELFENLSPPVTASLIKEGINPLQIPIDVLNQEAVRIKEKYKETDYQSFADYLVRLEDNKEISNEERESYIGIYRLLHQVEKTDGAAVGFLVHSNQEVTLNNLMTAIRTRQRGSVDANINDSFGVVEPSMLVNSITSQVNSAFVQKPEQEDVKSYQNHLLSRLNKEITPERIANANQTFGEALGGTSLEMLVENFEAYEKNEEEELISKLRMEQMREFSKNSLQEQQLLREFDIPDSMNNILAAKQLNENAAYLYQGIHELKKRFGDSFDSSESEIEDYTDSLMNEETIQSKFDELQVSTEKLLADVINKESIGAKDLELINQIHKTLKLTHALSKKEYYNIPVTTQSGIMAMNLTIIHQEEGNGQVKICYPSESSGNLRAELIVSDGKLKCFVTAQNRVGVSLLKQKEDTLVEAFKEIGLEVKELYFDIQYRDNSSFIFKNGSIYKVDKPLDEKGIKPSTNELYLAAKAVVTYLKEVDVDLQ